MGNRPADFPGDYDAHWHGEAQREHCTSQEVRFFPRYITSYRRGANNACVATRGRPLETR